MQATNHPGVYPQIFLSSSPHIYPLRKLNYPLSPSHPHPRSLASCNWLFSQHHHRSHPRFVGPIPCSSQLLVPIS